LFKPRFVGSNGEVSDGKRTGKGCGPPRDMDRKKPNRIGKTYRARTCLPNRRGPNSGRGDLGEDPSTKSLGGSVYGGKKTDQKGEGQKPINKQKSPCLSSIRRGTGHREGSRGNFWGLIGKLGRGLLRPDYGLRECALGGKRKEVKREQGEEAE